MRYTLGRWQGEGNNAYVQVHDGAAAIGALNMENVFTYSYANSYANSGFYNNMHYGNNVLSQEEYNRLKSLSGKKFKNQMDCLDNLNGDS